MHFFPAFASVSISDDVLKLEKTNTAVPARANAPIAIIFLIMKLNSG